MVDFKMEISRITALKWQIQLVINYTHFINKGQLRIGLKWYERVTNADVMERTK